MLISVTNVQECDATEAENSSTVSPYSYPFFCSLAQASFKVTVLLNTKRP